jgi:lysophospholipase
MDLLSIPQNPVPEGASVGPLCTSDGVTVRYARWQPPAGRKGTVCVFPGRAEFIEKYFEVVLDLRARGFSTAVLDWRGQGLSQRALRDRRKGHVGSFAEYDRDLEAFMQEVVLPDCPPPYYALAHSMGGAILIRAAEQGRRWFERTVISAPMIGLAGNAGTPGARATARWMRRCGFGRSYVPSGGATGIFSLPFEGNLLTSDPARYARTTAIVEAHPALALRSPTIAWLDAAYAVMDAFASPGYAARLRHPVVLVSAGADGIVSTLATEQFATQMRTGSHVTIAGARHEILMERDAYRNQFWAVFDAFVPGAT